MTNTILSADRDSLPVHAKGRRWPALIAALAATVLANNSASALDCSAEATLKAVPSSAQTEIDFRNASPQTRRLYWLDANGERTFIALVAPNSILKQPSSVGNSWVVTDEMEKCVTVVTAAQTPVTVDVGPVTVAAPKAPVPGVAVPLNQAPVTQAQSAPQQQAAAEPEPQPQPIETSPVEEFQLTGDFRLTPQTDPHKALNNRASNRPELVKVRPRWESGFWSFEAIPDSTLVRVKNKWKRTYLADDGRRLVALRNARDPAELAWQFLPIAGAPYVQLQNAKTGRFLVAERGEIRMADQPAKPGYAHWLLSPAGAAVPVVSKAGSRARERGVAVYEAPVASCNDNGGLWVGSECRLPQQAYRAPDGRRFLRHVVRSVAPLLGGHGQQGPGQQGFGGALQTNHAQGGGRHFGNGSPAAQPNTASTAPNFNKNAQSKGAPTTPNGTYHLTVTPGAPSSNTATNAAQSNHQGGKIGQIQRGNGNVTTTNVVTPLGKGVQTTNAKTGVTKVTITAPTGQAGQTGRITKMTNAKTGVTQTVVSAPGEKTVTTINANTGTTRTITATPTSKSVVTHNAKTGVTTDRATDANSKSTITEVRDPKTGRLIRGTANATSIDPKTGAVTRTRSVVTQSQTPGLVNAKTRTTTFDPKTGKATVTKKTSTINTATLKETVNSSSTKTRQVKTTSGGKSGRTQTANTNTSGGKGSQKNWQHNGKQFGGSNKNKSQANNSGAWKNKSGNGGGKIGRTRTANTNAGGKGSHKNWQHNGKQFSGSNKNKSQANNSGAWKNKSGKAARSNRQGGGNNHKFGQNGWSHHGNRSNQTARNGGNHNGSHHWQHQSGSRHWQRHNSGSFQSHGVFGGGGSGGGNWGAVGGAAVGAILSDVRLKHDIVLLKRLDNGIGLYRFRYNWSDRLYVGVMAQEVEAIRPDAVTRGADGYLRVTYGRLGLRFMTWSEWSKRKLAAH